MLLYFVCVICGRITHKYTQSIGKEETHVSPADLADLRRQTTKPKTTLTSPPHEPVFLCEIMQLAAFLCVICAICERITRKSTQSIRTNETPMSLPLISQIYADKPKTTSPNCLSLRNNAACCIPLRDLRYLRENTRKSTQTFRTEETPISPADLADLRRQTTKKQ